MIYELDSDEPKFFSEYITNQNVILNFWSIDCVPCKKEIPEILKTFSNSKNTKLYFINIDPKSEEEKVKLAIEEFKISQYSLLDIYQSAATSYIKPTLVVPASVIIDKKGKIVYESIGFETNTISNLEKKSKNLK